VVWQVAGHVNGRLDFGCAAWRIFQVSPRTNMLCRSLGKVKRNFARTPLVSPADLSSTSRPPFTAICTGPSPSSLVRLGVRYLSRDLLACALGGGGSGFFLRFFDKFCPTCAVGHPVGTD